MAWIDTLTDSMTGVWDGPVMDGGYLAMANGGVLRNSYSSGASQVKGASFAGMQAAMAGHNPYFIDNFNSSVNWLLVYPGLHHTSVNACVEVRHMFCQVLDSNDTWQWVFSGLPVWGKRVLGSDDASGTVGTQTKLPGGILKIQPGPAIALPSETESRARGYELWPSDWDGSNPAIPFYGAINRTLYAQMKAICFGVQVRLGLWDENGVDDRASAKFVAQIGNDPHANPNPGWRYISDAGVVSNTLGQGYPYRVFDANAARWRYITSNNWTWVTCVTADDLWGYEADTPPPWGNYSTKWPYNKAASGYAITTAELNANVPLQPPGDVTPEDPGGGSSTPTPTTGSWFAKTSGGANAWNSKSAANTASDKVRRRRVKIWE